MLDLHFLTDWESVQDRTKTRKAGVVSVLLHVGLIVLLLSLPKSVTAPVTEAIARQHHTPDRTAHRPDPDGPQPGQSE